MTDKIKEFISKEFDDRVIIIDEIQNIKTDKHKELSKTVQPILQAIIKYGKNIKLVLMSATPMFDRSDEIIFYLNLLLENDKRKLLNKNDIFNVKTGLLKPNAENILSTAMKGYISYMRAEKPFIFPFRINPINSSIPNVNYYISGKKIEEFNKIKYTNIISLQMHGVQENTYIHFLKTKLNEYILDELDNNYNNENNEISNNNEYSKNNKEKKTHHIHLISISNIIYPLSNNKGGIRSIGNFGKECIETTVDNGLGGYYKVINSHLSRRSVKYKYQKHAIFDLNKITESPFSDEKHIENYSTKFSSILKSINIQKDLFLYFLIL